MIAIGMKCETKYYLVTLTYLGRQRETRSLWLSSFLSAFNI